MENEVWYAEEPFGLDEYWYAYILTGDNKEVVAQVRGKTAEQCKERLDIIMSRLDEEDYNEMDLNT